MMVKLGEIVSGVVGKLLLMILFVVNMIKYMFIHVTLINIVNTLSFVLSCSSVRFVFIFISFVE